MGLFTDGFKLLKKASEPLYKTPKSIQETIEIMAVAENGIFEVSKNKYSKCYRFQDINYTTATEDEQIGIFERYCKFLNSLDCNYKITINNKNKNMDDLRDKVLIAEKNDGFNNYRRIYNDIIEEKIIEGRQGIEQERYLTITIERKNFEEAKAQFATLEATGRRIDSNEFNGLIANYLGRTYRKFIETGLKIYLDNRIVYLHDPLYMAGPTQFDTKETQDPKAQLYSEYAFDWDIPGRPGEKATIRIKLSLLPLEWRANIGDGGNNEAKKRKIDQNEGVSILRANREVLYDKIPYLIGQKRGQFSYQDNDRWWGCEISFPPELDECFQVRYIKRGAEPIGALKDRLKSELTGAITSLRKRIKEDRAIEKAKQNQVKNHFDNVADIMTDLDDVLPMNQTKNNMTQEEEAARIEKILDETAGSTGETEAERAARKEAINNRMYSILTVSYPASVLFETETLLGDKMVIKLNTNHAYYQKVIEPLCGEALKVDSADDSVDKAKVRDAIMLLILSYVKARSAMKDTDSNRMLFDNLESQWGSILSAVSSKIDNSEM